MKILAFVFVTIIFISVAQTPPTVSENWSALVNISGSLAPGGLYKMFASSMEVILQSDADVVTFCDSQGTSWTLQNGVCAVGCHYGHCCFTQQASNHWFLSRVENPSPQPPCFPPGCACICSFGLLNPFSQLAQTTFAGSCMNNAKATGKAWSMTISNLTITYCIDPDNVPLYFDTPFYHTDYVSWQDTVDCSVFIPPVPCTCELQVTTA